jgi:predicted deacylase
MADATDEFAETIYPIELAAPDIKKWRHSNVGVDYVHRFASKEPGSNLLVTGIVHGNELCGAIALDFLLRAKVRPIRGTLTLAFANVGAFLRFDAKRPHATRFIDEDFNRLWSPAVLDGKRQSAELARARALRPFVAEADFLLDIHSMQHDCAPVIVAGPLEKGRHLAHEVGYPAIVISDEGHAAGARMRDYGGFGDAQSPKNAMLVECGHHWEKASAEVAIQTMLRFLHVFDAVDPAFLKQHLRPGIETKQRIVEVTHAVTAATDDIVFAKPWKGLEVIRRAGTKLGTDGGKPIVTPYDDCVLVMPAPHFKKGQTVMRLGRFVG